MRFHDTQQVTHTGITGTTTFPDQLHATIAAIKYPAGQQIDRRLLTCCSGTAGTLLCSPYQAGMYALHPQQQVYPATVRVALLTALLGAGGIGQQAPQYHRLRTLQPHFFGCLRDPFAHGIQ